LFFKAQISPNLPTFIIPRFSKNYTYLFQYDPSHQMIYLSKFLYLDSAYQAPTTMKFKFEDQLLTTNEELIKQFSFAQTLKLLEGLQSEAEESGLADIEDLFSFLAIDESNLIMRIVFCGTLPENKFVCKTLLNKILVEEGQEYYPGYGSVKSLQLLKEEIIVILPNLIFHIRIDDIKKGTTLKYSRSMKHIQYFGGKWFGVSNNEAFFIMKSDPALGGELTDGTFFTFNKSHYYDKIVATDNHLIARYATPSGASGNSVFFYYDPQFFQERPGELTKVVQSKILPQPGI